MLKKLIFLIFPLIPIFVFGQSAGKLSGYVTDAETGAPLPGVNVIIEGTLLGGSTDLDGFYAILNVPAGTYTVKFLYVGYQSLEMNNIRVTPDVTKRVDAQLGATSLELDEVIVVTAERPFFETGATNTVRVMDADELSRIPVEGVTRKVALNAGVVSLDGSGGETDNAVINVRGGRGNESLIIIDGVPQNDLVFGNASGTIPDAAIEQVSSQLGGFSAKYGNAQSSVINIITKGGSPEYFGKVEALTSNFTDNYNYNLYNGTFGGPIIPGINNYTFFTSLEYMKTDDATPSAIGVDIPSAGLKSDVLPDNEGEVMRFVGKLSSRIGDNLKIDFSANGSFRKSRIYSHAFAKNDNTEHNQRIKENVVSSALQISHTIDNNTFWNTNLRYRYNDFRQGDGVFFDELDAYGDTLRNPYLIENGAGQGANANVDANGVFSSKGTVFDRFRKYKIETYGVDLNFTKQIGSHLLELGGLYEQSAISFFEVGVPTALALDLGTLTAAQRYNNAVADVRYYGYDITGSPLDKTRMRTIDGQAIEESAPKKPITAALFFQDKIEFDDFIFNLGLRFDYFDPAFDRIKDQSNVYGYGNSEILDKADFEKAPVEIYLTPRIGFAFPVTESTVFHAQYGVFRQQPTFFELYDSWTHINRLETDRMFTLRTGHLQSESTTQYEFGFKRQIGDVASLDITAFYKNIKGLTNTIQQISTNRENARPKNYYTPNNTDFGTIKGLAFAFNLRKMGPLSAKLDYTLSLAEGTGSSQASSYVAAFRNTNGEVPLSVAALSFDQRHTLTANLDIRAGNNEGPEIAGIKILENSGANFLISYNSGRPYTPASYLDLTEAGGTSFFNQGTVYSNAGQTTQYINTAYSPSNFRVDLKMDKLFHVSNFDIIAYLTVLNLFDRDNVVNVWSPTGEADNTGFLDTPAGEQKARGSGDEQAFISDYKALEKLPANYGIPRMIRLGLKVSF